MLGKSIRKLLAAVFLIGLVGTAFYLFVFVWLDVRLAPFNPPDQPNTLALDLSVYYGEQRYNPTRPPDLHAGIFLRYNGTLVAEKEVVVSGVANVSVDINYQPVLVVQVLFQTSHVYPPRNDSIGIPIDANLFLYRINRTTLLKGPPVAIYWPVPGDYSAIVRSFTKDYGLESAPSLNVIHVEPTSELLSERFNRVNQGLTVALTYFAFVEGIALIIESLGKNNGQKTTEQIHQEPKQKKG